MTDQVTNVSMEADIEYFKRKMLEVSGVPACYFTASKWENRWAEARFKHCIDKLTWRSRVWFFFYRIKAWLRRTCAEIAVFFGIC